MVALRGSAFVDGSQKLGHLLLAPSKVFGREALDDQETKVFHRPSINGLVLD